MTESSLTTICYQNTDRQVSWLGVSIEDGETFEFFLTNDVASRLHDEPGTEEFNTYLRGLASTGFAEESLNQVLAAIVPEERDWAVGESMAEAYLNREHEVTWPWNMERDKRTPKASLPGADLIGFKADGTEIRLVLGEVKTSSDIDAPPNVMNGRSGMAHQLDRLANDLSLIHRLLRWLLPRCKGTEHETSFRTALTGLLNSGNKAISLFGVLIRDIQPNQLDLTSRGRSLAGNLETPTTCKLIAIYLPCAITDLSVRVSGGGS